MPVTRTSGKHTQGMMPPPKKGEVRNPYGSRGKDPSRSALRKFGSKEFNKVMDMILTKNLAGLRDLMRDSDTSAFTAGCARAMFRACKEGDWKTLEGIAERMVGKVTVSVDHTSKGDKLPVSNERVVLYLPANGRTKEENEAKASTLGDDGFDLGF